MATSVVKFFGISEDTNKKHTVLMDVENGWNRKH